ncbi:hypothetical protein D4764_11G0010880 [Takifugu flavidus]|uniref:Immunoglobulin V-set domain-containing protein n=1 Tax=Takifugu flavidus TaxID=433684 RepID=A0A5C6PKQ4_9TELE|nr:hypothetical protein D4764_11G0010880 [Takifugu flavidus]
MSGLKMEDSGWYWCSRGDLQMPVQIIVREKPSTTAQPETFTSPELVSPSTTNEAEKPSTTDEAEKLSTTDEDASNSLSGVVMIVIISLYLFIVMPMCSENEVTYSSVKIPGPERRPKETTDIYSKLANSRKL